MAWRLPTYVALQRLIGSRAGERYQDFLRCERMSPAALSEIHRERLGAELAGAARDIPFYRDRVRAERPALHDFPVLSKSAVREYADRLKHPTLGAAGGYGWIEVRTGGSTGEPTTVIHGAPFRDAGRASRLFSQRLCGFPFGVPYHRLWGSMAEVNQMRDSRAARLTRVLARETVWNAFRLDDAGMAGFLDDLRRKNALHVMAYIDALDAVARYAESHPSEPIHLDSIMACAGTVTEAVRARLQRVFGARVHNKYGSRECTDMACECEHGGLHVYSNHVALEIVDDQDQPCPPGVTGRVLVTLLGNQAFPLIRYEIGDMAAWSARKTCACGRPFPLLERIEGRQVEFLRGTDGAYVSPVYIRHLIGVVHAAADIRRFQFVQESPTRFSFTVESLDAMPEHREPLLEDLRNVLGRDAEIAWRVTPSFPETPGKFLYCINRMSR